MNTTPRGAIETAGDTPNAPTGRQYFFGIGVDTYEHFPSLANAGKDVEDICAALCEHYYFERADTALLKGPAANRRNILRQLDAYRRNLTPDDRLLIYYAGHGLFDGGLGFWVPAEAERDEISTYIGNAEVREILRNIPARHILLISDSCFSASLLVRDANRDARAFEDFERNPSRWVFISGKGVVSDGKPGQNSPFAAGILKHLRQNTEKAINIAHLADRVTKEVRFNYEQHAEATPLYQAGHEGGQFVFRRRQVEADAWAAALSANTEGSLLHYLRQYPHGQFAAEADRRLADIADVRAWAKASQQDAAFAYRNYLRDYPQGQHAAEARAKLDGFLAEEKARAESERLEREKQERLAREQRERETAEREQQAREAEQRRAESERLEREKQGRLAREQQARETAEREQQAREAEQRRAESERLEREKQERLAREQQESRANQSAPQYNQETATPPNHRKTFKYFGAATLSLGAFVMVLAGAIYALFFSRTDKPKPTPEKTTQIVTPPDRDQDGIADQDDQCPDRKGTAAHKGCPPPAAPEPTTNPNTQPKNTEEGPLPKDPRAERERQTREAEQRKKEEAAQQMRKAVKQHLQNALAQLNAGEPTDAQTALQKALNVANLPADWAKSIKSAKAHISAEEYGDAKRQLKELIDN